MGIAVGMLGDDAFHLHQFVHDEVRPRVVPRDDNRHDGQRCNDRYPPPRVARNSLHVPSPFDEFSAVRKLP